MKLRNLIVCVTLPLLVVASGPRLFSAQAADARPSSTRQTNAPDGISSAAVPEPEVEVALSIPGDPRRVNLNEKQRIMARAIGKVAGTNHFELWLDGRLAASVFAPPAYPAPQIPKLKLPEHVETGFIWTPRTYI